MSTKRKLLVALAVFLLVIGGFVFYVWRGTPAEHTTEQLSGKDPVLFLSDPPGIDRAHRRALLDDLGALNRGTLAAAQAMTG